MSIYTSPFANEPRFPNSYFCLVFFGRKTISFSSYLFPFSSFVATNSVWGSQNHHLHTLQYFLLNSFFVSPFIVCKNIGNLYPSRDVSGNSSTFLCVNREAPLLFLAASGVVYDVFRKVTIMKVLWAGKGNIFQEDKI